MRNLVYTIDGTYTTASFTEAEKAKAEGKKVTISLKEAGGRPSKLEKKWAEKRAKALKEKE